MAQHIVSKWRVSVVAVLATLVGVAILPARADASCAVPEMRLDPALLGWAPPPTEGPTALARAGAVRAAGLQSGGQGSGPIAGLWEVVFLAAPGTPDEFVFDFTFQQFHNDGTELMISGGAPPANGNVCIGTWERGAGGEITLRHVTWIWAGDEAFGDPPAGYFHMVVVLRPNQQGTAYTGTWRSGFYDLGTGPLRGGADIPQPGTEFSGTVHGVRISVQ